MRYRYRYRLKDVPALMCTPVGRKHCIQGACRFAWPLLSLLAGLYRRTVVRKTRIIAVVGSFGKTTTMRAVAAALGKEISPTAPRNFRSFIARAIFRIRPRDRHAVIEIGITAPGDMQKYTPVVRPDITVVTSIGSEHNRSLKTLENTRAEKMRMVSVLPVSGIAVLNGDDSNVSWMKDKTRARVITFGTGSQNHVRASDIELDWPAGTRFQLHAYGQTREVHVKLIGKYMVYPILAAIAVALAEGSTLDEILPELEALAPTPRRMQPVPLENGAFVLADDFKSTPETVEAALDVFSQIPAKRRIVVMGDLSEVSHRPRPVYRHIGERIGRIASRLILLSRSQMVKHCCKVGAVKAGLPRPSIVFAGESVLKAVEELRSILDPGDVVLLKGRHSQKLSRIAHALTGRKVKCDIPVCHTKAVTCEECPMLEKGWGGRRAVV